MKIVWSFRNRQRDIHAPPRQWLWRCGSRQSLIFSFELPSLCVSEWMRATGCLGNVRRSSHLYNYHVSPFSVTANFSPPPSTCGHSGKLPTPRCSNWIKLGKVQTLFLTCRIIPWCDTNHCISHLSSGLPRPCLFRYRSFNGPRNEGLFASETFR